MNAVIVGDTLWLMCVLACICHCVFIVLTEPYINPIMIVILGALGCGTLITIGMFKLAFIKKSHRYVSLGQVLMYGLHLHSYHINALDQVQGWSECVYVLLGSLRISLAASKYSHDVHACIVMQALFVRGAHDHSAFLTLVCATVCMIIYIHVLLRACMYMYAYVFIHACTCTHIYL